MSTKRDHSQVFVPYVLIMKSCSLSQIVSFTDEHLLHLRHSITYLTFFTVQVISLFTLKILPLKLYELSSLMYLHSPHLGSLHFVTFGVCSCLFVNLAFVNSFFKLGGRHLLFKKDLLLKIDFNLLSLESNDLFHIRFP